MISTLMDRRPDDGMTLEDFWHKTNLYLRTTSYSEGSYGEVQPAWNQGLTTLNAASVIRGLRAKAVLP